MSSPIPRFLLPRASAIWRSKPLPIARSSQLRAVSNKTKHAANKPRVLEKPTKFNPPSHGSRLRNATPKNYPGPILSAEEIARNSKKKYPTMMAAEGTFMHWFLNNRGIHVWITLSVLASIAGFTFITNFKQNTKFSDMLPPSKDFIYHPISAFRQCREVLKLHTAAVAAETAERRQRKVDDIAKRDLYRKAHGLDTTGYGGWTAKANEGLFQNGENTGAGGQGNVETGAGAVANAEDGGLAEHVEQQQRPKKPLKMWLGIW